jgi:hypothetical protein
LEISKTLPGNGQFQPVQLMTCFACLPLLELIRVFSLFELVTPLPV